MSTRNARQLSIAASVALATLAVISSSIRAADLTIEDGVVVKLNPTTQITVRDGIKVGKGVVFTSAKDDTVGGQTGKTAQTPTLGDWGGIKLEASAAPVVLGDATIKFGGAGGAAALDIRKIAPAVNYVEVRNSVVGVRVSDNANIRFEGVSLLSNATGLQIVNAAPVIVNSHIEGNTTVGIENQTSATIIQATGNWWGNASGPNDSADNPAGLGDAVSVGINYANWATVVPLLNPSVTVAGNVYSTDQSALTLNLGCRNAVEYRVAENSSFAGLAFLPMTGSTPFTLSSGDGIKQIAAQYRASTGNIVTVNLPQGVLYDTQGPTLAVTNPAAGSYITKSISVDASATDPAGVTKVEFYIDDVLAFTDTSSPFSYAWNVTSVADGNHNIKTIAYDGAAHNTTDTRVVTLTKEGPPPPDTAGPAMANLKLGSTALVEAGTITRSGIVNATATDPSGVARIEFVLDGTVFGTDSNGSDGYGAFLELANLTDGNHVLTLRAYDSLNNASQTTLNIVVALAAPNAPTLTQPLNNTATNQQQVTVAGTAEKFMQVVLYNNGAPIADNGTPLAPIEVGSSGAYSAVVTLVKGTNSLQALAQNRGGASTLSATRLVTLDASIPGAPVGLAATPQAGGKVRLSWIKPSDAAVVGYHIYRSPLGFAAISEATKLTGTAITATSYDDLPAADGAYYYRATAVNSFGTHSAVSNQANANADNTMPRALAIEYTPTGKVDAATGRIATGRVNVFVKVSEPLLTAPFLSISPENGIPIAIELLRQTDTEYTGGFDITSNTPVGTAYAVFSARDLVGNRGTEVNSGASINIDSQGPAVAALSVTPGAPIKNDSTTPATLNVAFTLNEAMKPGETPQLTYVLASAPGTETPITNVTATTPLNWQASFVLPSSAGQTQTDTLRFGYRGVDDLDNVATTINTVNAYEVYQGNLPPLNVPVSMTATAQANGGIRLSWNTMEGAVAYQLHRQGPGETELTAYQRIVAGADAPQFLDAPATDGVYRYAVASIRQSNGQESQSPVGTIVQATADRVAPGAPQNLALSMTGAGIYAAWQAATGDVLYYQLYRATGTSITSVAGLTPIKRNMKVLAVIDGQPSLNEHAYAVTAIDAAGNESPISNSAYLNFALLPVSTLNVVQTNNELPIISWTHTGSTLAGYDVYLGPDASKTKLNGALIAGRSYTDTGYVYDERRYTVVAVDTNGVEAARSIVLSKVTAQLQSGTPLKRGLMNRLQYQVTNHASARLDNVALKVRITNRDHVSEPFALAAGETRLVPIIVGGYSDLPNLATMAASVDVIPNEGERVQIARTSDVDVQDGVLVTAMATETFTRGATGKVRFTLENTSDVDIEVVTATQTGNAASNELRFKLLDKDNNVLTTQSFKQILGTGIITLANGRTVARIPARGSFTSDLIEIPVPVSAPETVTVQLEIDKLHYRLGQADTVSIQGMSNRRSISLIDTAYAGEVTSIAPLASFGDQNVIIQGRAVDRTTAQSLPNVALKVVLRINGFERKFDVFTDATGNYSYSFTPDTSDAGTYKVSVVHPDLLDRPDHGQFVISQVRVEPTQINVNLPRNYTQQMPIKVTAGDGTVANNVRLVYAAEDQPSGSLANGVNVTLSSPIALASKQTGQLAATLNANNTAAEIGSLFLKVLSDERGTVPLGKVKVDYRFTDAKPVLFFTPNFVETGVSQGGSVTEQIVLENRGFAAMDNVVIKLLNADNTPAPAWAYLTGNAQLGNVAIGEKRIIDIAIAPPANVVDGNYSFKLNIAGTNVPTANIGVYAAVTQSGVGNALFKVSDIYTATLDKNGNRIPGLAGARIRVQNEQVLTIDHTIATDSYGEAYLAGLPTGQYKFRATAANHQEIGGRFSIKPGVTTAQDVFMEYNLVTVEWSVTEIAIQDKYEITLTATYETDVPAAVVVLEPASVSLPTLKPGDVFYGEFTLTNYGLIRADNVKALLPPSDAYYRYEFLKEIPATLNAKQRITLPYRAVSLQSFEPTGTATGGGCYTYQPRVSINYEYTCVNGVIATGSTGGHFFYSYGSCSGGGGAGGGGPVYYGCANCTGSGGGSPVAPTALPGAPPCKGCKKPKCCERGGGGGGGD